jgi:hypothetical protein
MSKLINITAPQHRCTLGACPAVYTDLTPAEHRCEISVSCPAVLRTEGRYVIIGKRLDPEAEGLSGKVGESEAAVEIPAEILLSALGVDDLVEAAKTIIDILDRSEKQYAETPTLPDEIEDLDILFVRAGEIRALRSAIKRAKGGE